MKRIYQKELVTEALAKSKYRTMLERLPVELFLTEYEAGEFLPPPEKGNHLLQFVVEGSISIDYIRDDGSSYALALSGNDEILGQMELFDGGRTEGVTAQVTRKLNCIAFLINENKELLLNDAEFMRIIAENLSNTIRTITMQNAALPSLRERVYAYMYYKCADKTIRGVEKAAFQLHCSPRQLQRILNAFTEDGTAKKLSKGTYELV